MTSDIMAMGKMATDIRGNMRSHYGEQIHIKADEMTTIAKTQTISSHFI